MNNRGNIMLSLLFFILALGVMVAFVSPINDFVDISQQSDHMNCKGFRYDGSTTHALSFNESKNNNQSGSPLGCLAVKLYLPYILLVFLIGGLASVLGGRGAELIGLGRD